MPSVTTDDIKDFSDSSAWLNNRLLSDSVSMDSLESYLNSLQLSLTLLAQECADSDDILAGQYLAQMPALSTDVERMLEEADSAANRLKALQAFKNHQESSTNLANPFAEISNITSALEKVQLVKKALQRGKRLSR